MNATAESVGSNGQGAVAEPKSVGEVVEMEDGSKITFAGKKRMIKSSLIDNETVTVRFDFRNGKTLTYTPNEGLILRLAAHGAEQKIGDETAGTTEVDDAYEDVRDLIERLNQGEWNVKREGGGFAGTSILMKALMEASGKPEEAIRAFLKGKSQAEKLAMRASSKLAPIVERLEKEKVAKAAKVDTSALFAQLDAVGGDAVEAA